MIFHLEDGPLGKFVGNYLDCIHQGKENSLCPLWVVPFPGRNPGLYKWRKATET